MTRTIAGLLLAPLGALAVAGSIDVFFLNGDWSTARLSNTSNSVLGLGWGIVLVAAAPAVEFLRRNGSFTLGRCLWLGVGLGALPIVVFHMWYLVAVVSEAVTRRGEATYPGVEQGLRTLAGLVPLGVGQLLLGVACGLASAGVFWVIGARGNERFAAGA